MKTKTSTADIFGSRNQSAWLCATQNLTVKTRFRSLWPGPSVFDMLCLTQ